MFTVVSSFHCDYSEKKKASKKGKFAHTRAHNIVLGKKKINK